MKRLVLLAGLAATLLGVAACNSSTPGQATAGTSTTTQNQPPPTSSSGGGNSLPVSNPCSLLSSGDLSQLGVTTTPTKNQIGTAHACELDNAEGHIIVGIRTNVGLDGYQPNGGTVKDLTVGSHQAKQEVDATGSCIIALGVSSSSRVDITVTGDGTNDPCPTTMSVAQLVEPKLP